MDAGELIATVLAGTAIAVGVVGTVVPILPGVGLIWLAMVGYGLAVGFGWQGTVALVLATLLAGLGIVLGVRIPQRSAAGEGVSVRGQLFGALLAVIGFFLIPVVGAPVGFVVGVWLVRWRASGDVRVAWESTRRTIASLIRAGAAQFGCAVGMAITWAGWVLLAS